MPLFLIRDFDVEKRKCTKVLNIIEISPKMVMVKTGVINLGLFRCGRL